jgi:hypothetical protein
MRPVDVRKIVEMLDEVIRGRRGAALFREEGPSNLAVVWMAEVEKVGDADVATQAVADLFVHTPHDRIPTPSDFRAAVAKIRADRKSATPTIEEKLPHEMPDWVAAKLLALCEGDLRVWPQQEYGYFKLQEWSPFFRTYVWGEQEQMPGDRQEHFLGRVLELDGTQRAELMHRVIGAA